MSQKARKKLEKKAGTDYPLFLADCRLEDTFNMIMHFINLKLTLVQRLTEFTNEKLVSLKFSRWMPARPRSLMKWRK